MHLHTPPFCPPQERSSGLPRAPPPAGFKGKASHQRTTGRPPWPLPGPDPRPPTPGPRPPTPGPRPRPPPNPPLPPPVPTPPPSPPPSQSDGDCHRRRRRRADEEEEEKRCRPTYPPSPPPNRPRPLGPRPDVPTPPPSPHRRISAPTFATPVRKAGLLDTRHAVLGLLSSMSAAADFRGAGRGSAAIMTSQQGAEEESPGTAAAAAGVLPSKPAPAPASGPGPKTSSTASAGETPTTQHTAMPPRMAPPPSGVGVVFTKQQQPRELQACCEICQKGPAIRNSVTKVVPLLPTATSAASEDEDGSAGRDACRAASPDYGPAGAPVLLRPSQPRGDGTT